MSMLPRKTSRRYQLVAKIESLPLVPSEAIRSFIPQKTTFTSAPSFLRTQSKPCTGGSVEVVTLGGSGGGGGATAAGGASFLGAC
jgi:hypothetical protein